MLVPLIFYSNSLPFSANGSPTSVSTPLFCFFKAHIVYYLLKGRPEVVFLTGSKNLVDEPEQEMTFGTQFCHTMLYLSHFKLAHGMKTTLTLFNFLKLAFGH